ncbi:MAG: fibronectin type III domain-containing protein [Candidatus Aminicenantes bacterium]|nr:fibronectin type III domain-containing protein [Candidatus Aminicenantes bacterium]
MFKKFIIVLIFLVVMVTAHFAAADDVNNNTKLIIGDVPGETFIIDKNTNFHQNADIGVIGSGRLIVLGKLFLTGHMYVAGNGLMIVYGGEFHLKGNNKNIYVGENGGVIFVNNAFLHYEQTYVSQHNIIAWGSGKVWLEDTRVNCDGSIEFIYLRDNSSYTAKGVTYEHWKTWYLWDQTSLTLENVNIAGDIVFYDSPTMRFKDTNVIMPWLYFDNGAVVDYKFPKPKYKTEPVTMTFDGNLPGVSGIPWTLILDNCRYIAWGINPYPGSCVTVRDSDLKMIMYRFTGADTFNLQGIMVNDSFYGDTTVPVTDRILRLVNTNVKWWKVDIVDDFELTADSIVFSEMVSKDNAKAYLTNSICQGQTINLGATGNSFIHFKDGEVWSYVSVWTDATLILENSLVDWEKGEYIYQRSNIAHGRSRLYCLNSTLKSLPQAYDEALVLFSKIAAPETGVVDSTIEISGSAWIEAGPENPAIFDHYELAWAPEGSSNWTLIKNSAASVKDGILCLWDTTGLTPGNYRVRLKVRTGGYSGNFPTEDFPAYAEIKLLGVNYFLKRK